MLLPDNIHPENSIYYNASFLIEALKINKSYILLDLFLIIKSKKEMSFSVFVLCIDWLYLIEIITLNKEGEIILCS